MDELIAALLALLTALVGVAGVMARAYLADWMARQRLEGALGRAAGLVMQDTAVQAAGQAAVDAAIKAAAGYVQGAIPGTLAKLGVDDGRLTQMVRGEVGKIAGRVL
jgi:hypothetical protein